MIIGIAIMVIGSVVSILKGAKGEVKTGGVILIGPLPIVWGSESKWAIIALILLVIVLIIFMLLHSYLAIKVGW